jgi:hypothetical protein
MYQLMEFGAIFSNKESDLLKSCSKLQTHSRVSCLGYDANQFLTDFLHMQLKGRGPQIDLNFVDIFG